MKRPVPRDVYSDWLEHARLEHPYDYQRFKRYLDKHK